MDKSMYTWSDLACEMLPTSPAATEPNVRQVGDIRILRLHIEKEQEQIIRRPSGTYVTLECGSLHRLEKEKRRMLSRIVAGELAGLCEKLTGKRAGAGVSVLAVGLGNRELTADAVGPLTAAGISATRHLQQTEEALFSELECASLSVLAPGVVGQTGMESAEMIGAVVADVRPDLVLVTDALAARDVSHLATTVQLSTGGIAPGSGVGNHRAAINRETIGVPVIVMGVPTVVSSSALVYDALERAGIEEHSPEICEVLETGRDFLVSPKESDLICRRAAEILSDAVMLAFGGHFRALTE